ncbi:P-loop NTPase fold protein [Vreelandella venusta]|uniref:P-loop NTPase fold protein n=1 Tax=Vreelandella venusta TaxID=44935 RepID=UPI003F67409F
MDTLEGTVKEKGVFQFERPEEHDLFSGKGHESAANGIHDVILNHDDVHIIGVEGNLGAGKSTVIKILEKKLNPDKYRFVYFDADTYQHSSTKAAFIKVFYNKIKGISKKGSLNDVKEAKNKALGYHVEYTKATDSALSFYVISFLGAMFLFFRNIKEGLEVLILSLPNIFSGEGVFMTEGFLSVALSMSPFWLWFFILIRNKFVDEKERVTLGNLFKRNSKDTINETFEITKEVGSFELKEAFSVFSKSIPENIVVILVIDNIDRVDPDKAKEVWSDLDIFTSISNERIKTILPYSEEHLATSISSDPLEGKEYIAKRLPVVFRAPPIVTAGWRDQFNLYWLETLGEIQNSDKCADLIDIWRDDKSQVTPRMLKKHINDIACTNIGNAKSLSCAVACSAYLLAVKKYNVSLNVLLAANDVEMDDKVIERKIAATRRVLNSLYDVAEWTEQIACIHYQTGKDVARSELLYEPIIHSVKNYNTEELMRLSKVFGFDVFFQRTIESLDSREMIKLASYISEDKEKGNKQWLLKWLPRINAKTRMESVPKDFDLKYVKSVDALCKKKYDVELKFIREGIKITSEILLNDTDSREAALQELYAYSQVELKIPKVIVEITPDIFVDYIWPNKDQFPSWNLDDVKMDKDKISAIAASAMSRSVNDEFYNAGIFEWLMPKHRIGFVNYYDEQSPTKGIEIDFVNAGAVSVFSIAYYYKLLDSSTVSKIVIALKEGQLKGDMDQWAALLLFVTSAGNKYQEKITHRINGRQPANYVLGDVVVDLVKKNQGYKKYIPLLLRLSPSFVDLIGSLSKSSMKPFISGFIKNVVIDKQVSRLDVDSFITGDGYNLFYESNNDVDADVMLDFLEGWSTKIEVNLMEACEFLILAIIDSGKEIWISKLKKDFERWCSASENLERLVRKPSVNEANVLEWFSQKNYSLKTSRELRSTIEDFFDSVDHNDIGSYADIEKRLSYMLKIMRQDTMRALVRYMQAKIMDSTTSYAKRFFIIESFSNFLELKTADTDSARDIYILLVEQAESISVLEWLDKQGWSLNGWSNDQISHLIEAIEKHSDRCEFGKLKSNLIIKKHLKDHEE